MARAAANAEASQGQDLTALFAEIERACGTKKKVTIRDVEEAIGERSFGPLLLIPGLAALTPIGIIPGAPTLLAIVIVLIAGQLVIGRSEFWLPKFLAERSVKGARLKSSLHKVRPAARFLDRILKPRLTFLTGRVGLRVAAGVCLLVALLIPPMELVPFGVAAPATAIVAFGLGFTTRDGLLTLIALIASAASVGLIVWALVF